MAFVQNLSKRSACAAIGSSVVILKLDFDSAEGTIKYIKHMKICPTKLWRIKIFGGIQVFWGYKKILENSLIFAVYKN